MTETARKFREALHAEREYFEDRVGRDTETNRKGFVKLYPVDCLLYTSPSPRDS